MRMFSRFTSLFSSRKAKRNNTPIRYSSSDAATTTNENSEHWANATDRTVAAEYTPEVRRKLRMRSRYEVQNNTYAAGLVRTLVGDTVGTGPRLQMLTPDATLNEAVESEWKNWCAATNFNLNIRVAAGTQIVAGEVFGVFRESKKLERLGLPVTLDLRLIEPDQICDPDADYFFKKTGDDGIVCDEDGEVVAYKILKSPANEDIRFFVNKWDYDTVPAANVVHYFHPVRPGQLRGATPLEPALPIFAQLRRFSMATLTAAEIAAMLAGVMEQAGPTGDGGDETLATATALKLVRGMMIATPPGARAVQFKPEQPTTNYEMYVLMKLGEIGRCMEIPLEKMSGDYSRTNYSGGKLSDRIYRTGRSIDRQLIETAILNPTLYKFTDFLRFSIPSLAAYKGKPWELKHTWHYDGAVAIEPVKEATGDEINLTNATDTLAAIAMRDGTTVEEILDQRAREKQMFEERGLPLPPWLDPMAGKPVRAPQEVAVPA